jgi:predicted membrane channel-forming protein YqfA (hemolysin III family)
LIFTALPSQTYFLTIITNMTVTGRVGVFIIFMSLIVLLVYSLTAQADQPNLTALFVGIIGLILGGIIVWRNRSPQEPDERFRSLRTSRAERAEKKKMKKEQKQG